MSSPSFADLLRVLVQDTGITKAEFARLVGIHPTRLSRLLRGGPRGGPDLRICLKIASISGASPTRLLHAAGLDAEADLIESLYGPAALRRQQFLDATGRLGLSEQRLIQVWRRLSPGDRRTLLHMMERAVDNLKTTR